MSLCWKCDRNVYFISFGIDDVLIFSKTLPCVRYLPYGKFTIQQNYSFVYFVLKLSHNTELNNSNLEVLTRKKTPICIKLSENDLMVLINVDDLKATQFSFASLGI